MSIILINKVYCVQESVSNHVYFDNYAFKPNFFLLVTSNNIVIYYCHQLIMDVEIDKGDQLDRKEWIRPVVGPIFFNPCCKGETRNAKNLKLPFVPEVSFAQKSI